MVRWAGYILCALSLLLTIPSAVLWVRGAFVYDNFWLTTSNHQFHIGSWRGAVTFDVVRHASNGVHYDWHSDEEGADEYWGLAPLPIPDATRFYILGLGYMSAPVIGPEPGYTDFCLLRVPVWLGLSGLVALAALGWLMTRWRNRLRAQPRGKPCP